MNRQQRVRIATFDLDGTLVSRHVWLGLAKYHFRTKKNRFSVFWYIFSNMALTPFWKMGFMSQEKYYESWGKGIASMMKGIDKDKAKEIFQWLSDEYLLPSKNEKIIRRLKEHQREGFLTILISGSFQALLKTIANRLNIKIFIGTELEIKKDKFTGKIIPPLCFGKKKLEKLKNFFSREKLKVNLAESFAYSDSFFDLPMLELVGHPIVVEPDKKLLTVASKRGWRVI